MVLKEFSRIEVELNLLLTDIRSGIRLQVAKFPGAGPHRIHREKPEHRRHEEKKKI